MNAHPLQATIVAAGLLLALPGSGRAAEYVRDPAKVQPGSYVVEPEHTQILFGISHFGFSTYYGRFAQASGSLNFDPTAPANSNLTVTVPTASVSTPSDKLNDILKSAGWFDVAKFPTMSFKATKATVVGADHGTLIGDLTLHGVTRPITLDVTFDGAGVDPADSKYTIGFDATGVIKRTDFGISTFAPYIGDEVRLILSGAFEKQG